MAKKFSDRPSYPLSTLEAPRTACPALEYAG
jgi:hypothetical protein